MPTDTPARPGLTLIAWKPMVRNSLRGFADIRLPIGLVIHDVTIHQANGKAWASLPSKPILGTDGVAKRDDATGKVRYLTILEWPDRNTSDRFSDAVVDAVEAMHPGAVLR